MVWKLLWLLPGIYQICLVWSLRIRYTICCTGWGLYFVTNFDQSLFGHYYPKEQKFAFRVDSSRTSHILAHVIVQWRKNGCQIKIEKPREYVFREILIQSICLALKGVSNIDIAWFSNSSESKQIWIFTSETDRKSCNFVKWKLENLGLSSRPPLIVILPKILKSDLPMNSETKIVLDLSLMHTWPAQPILVQSMVTLWWRDIPNKEFNKVLFIYH